MRSGDVELDGLTPEESEKLRTRIEAWLEAKKALEPLARGEEPLFPGDLENPA